MRERQNWRQMFLKMKPAMIYNNGQPPEREIREGGGLTNLRHRIETEGGRMLVQSFPEFALVIEIPKI